MRKLSQPLHGIRRTPIKGWEVWSVILQFPVACGSPADAKRVASALELAYPSGLLDLSEVEAAIDAAGNGHSVANIRLS